MNAKDILARKFEKGFNGYKIDDVDEFMKEMSEEFGNLQKENRDLEKKLEVLADKIREYRNDEDALKEALLGAQKQGQQAIADAKEKARNIISDAETQSEVIKNAAEEQKRLLNDEGEKLKSDAENEAERIVKEANDKSDKILSEMNYQIEMNREILSRLKNETSDYNERLISSYKEHINRLEALPGECENEYVNRTVDEHNKEMEQKQANKASNVNAIDIIKNAVEEDDEQNFELSDSSENDGFEFAYEDEQSYEVNELSFSKVFEEENDVDNTEDFNAKQTNKSDETNSTNNIFFKKSNSNANKSGSLEFGNRSKETKNKK